MKKYFSLLLVAVLMLGCNSNYHSENNRKEKIEQIKELLVHARAEYKLSAVLFTWREGDHEVMSMALGTSTPEMPAHTKLNYRAGGVTETMLTTILMRMIEDSKYQRVQLSLDDTIDKWFPEFPHSNQITLRMLANSTSGYYDFLFSKDMLKDNALYTKNWDPMELIKIGVEHPLSFPPGSKFEYSHTNFCILGLILEKISHHSLPDLVARYISKPLRLQNTQYITSSEIPLEKLHSYGFDLDGNFVDATDWSPSWAGPSGLVVSNLSDIGKWMIVFGRGDMLSIESRQQMTKVKNPELDFAFGFIVSNGWYYQNPSINGYKTVAAYYQPKDMSIVLTTTDGKDSNTPGGPDKHFAKIIFPQIAQILNPGKPTVRVPGGQN